MATLKNDIDSNTSLTRGVQLFGLTRARRGFHVSGQGGTSRENLVNAAQQFIDSHDTSGDGTPIHPDYLTYRDLPLAAVHVTPFGEGTSGIGVYYRTNAVPPRFKAFESAGERWYRAGRRVVRVFPTTATYTYTKSGTNYGDNWSLDRYIPISKEYRRNQITVNTLLNEHPNIHIKRVLNIDDMSGIFQSINDQPITINGVDRPRGTVRLDGINVTPVETPDRVKFEVQYIFTEDPYTWFHRLLEIELAVCSNISPTPTSDQGCPTTGSVTTIYRETLIESEYTTPSGIFTIYPSYKVVDFEGVFPVHDQLDGYVSAGEGGTDTGRPTEDVARG